MLKNLVLSALALASGAVHPVMAQHQHGHRTSGPIGKPINPVSGQHHIRPPRKGRLNAKRAKVFRSTARMMTAGAAQAEYVAVKGTKWGGTTLRLKAGCTRDVYQTLKCSHS